MKDKQELLEKRKKIIEEVTKARQQINKRTFKSTKIEHKKIKKLLEELAIINKNLLT